MSDAADALIARIAEARLRYRNVPRETAIEIIEETLGKLLLLPSAQGVEDAAIKAADAGAAALVTLLVPGASVLGAPIAAKGVDLLLHAVITWLEHRYQDAQARARQEAAR